METQSSSIELTEEQAALYAQCATDPWYFMTTYIHIDDPNRGDLVFEAWDHLHKLLDYVMADDRVIILKARQIGITWLIAAYSLWLCLFRPNSKVLVVSEDQTKSTEFKNRCRYMYDRIPEWLQIRDERLDKDNDQLIEFGAMDSAIHSLPAVKGAGRSFTATLVVLDEWAFQEYGSSIYTAILPTVEFGKLIGISTANGRNNIFYTIWMRAKNKINTFLPIFIPYFTRPGRNKKWWDETAANMETIDEAMREYPKDEAEAFTVQAESYFDRNGLDRMALIDPNPWGNYSYIWTTPDTANHSYVAGCDPAPGGGDPSVLNILDDTGKQVARTSTNDDIDMFAAEAFELLKHYGFPYLVPERQGEGNTAIRYFLKHGYPEHKIYHSAKNTPGWYTTQFNREDILADIRKAVRTNDIIFRCTETVVEFKGFGKNKDGKLEGIYGHDDEVMSMALAWYGFSTVPPPLEASEWQPTQYISETGKPTSAKQLDWKKKVPLMCVFMILEEGKPRRRCGIHHTSLEAMQQCQH